MRTVVFEAGHEGLRWVDVSGPTRQELLELAEEFGLHATSVADCLDPEHLPKYERIGDATFLILRLHDDSSDPQAVDLHAMTRKVALFYRSDLVLTIHRKDQPVLADVRERFREGNEAERSLTGVLTAIVLAVIASFDRPLDEMERALDAFEEEVFDLQRTSPPFRRVHVLKRRVTLIKRVLHQTIGVLQRMTPHTDRAQPYFQDMRESAEGSHFWAEAILDEAQHLLNVHLAMANHRTNEVMRVLTVFAAFFLPLTFVVGIYGMNFDWMPELRQRWGYPLTLLLMAGVSLAIYLWFRRRGWIGGGAR